MGNSLVSELDRLLETRKGKNLGSSLGNLWASLWVAPKDSQTDNSKDKTLGNSLVAPREMKLGSWKDKT